MERKVDRKQQTPGQRALELIRLLLPNWQPATQDVLRWIRIAIAVGIVILGVLLILDVISTIFGITLWKLLSVLAIPITLGAVVPLLSWLQSTRERQIAADTEEASRKRELEVVGQRAQDEALQAYLDDMTNLMIDYHLRSPSQGEDVKDVRAVARSRTLTALPRLDARRKRSVLQFLYESDLATKDQVAVDLKGADLSGAHLSAANLSAADLSGVDLRSARLNAVDLREADLSDADLSDTDLSAANLHEADLSGADLLRSDLSAADLIGADLSGADLSGAHLTGANLDGANLSGVDLRGTYLRAAHLRKVDLRGARLEGVHLEGANLQGAHLEGANFAEAHLEEANLEGAHLEGANFAEAHLEEANLEGANLEGATMPNRHNYEGRLYDREGHGEDEKSSGPSQRV